MPTADSLEETSNLASLQDKLALINISLHTYRQQKKTVIGTLRSEVLTHLLLYNLSFSDLKQDQLNLKAYYSVEYGIKILKHFELTSLLPGPR